jgi:lysophospholipase L1-like esterase
MKILFQGDSITDGGRDRNDPHSVGWGYALYATRYLRERHPDMEFEFLNFGISGNQTSDLVGRWTTDCIEWQPDVVSIMIGVNDTWHRAHNREWLSNEQFEANYRNLLERIKNETNAKIIMMEQFLLPTDDKEYFREDINPKIMITRKLAREFADVYVPIDGYFAAACVERDSLYWSDDGVHPNNNGSALIARHYADAVDKILENM